MTQHVKGLPYSKSYLLALRRYWQNAIARNAERDGAAAHSVLYAEKRLARVNAMLAGAR